MEKIWTKALRDSISEVFSTMFFMVPEEDTSLMDRIAGEPASGWMEGWIDLTGPEENVRLWIWAPGGLAKELAGNILSSDPEELGEDDVIDAYSEMINMVTGSHLTVVDKQTQWRMGLPQARRPSGDNVGEMVSPADWNLMFDVEGMPLVTGCQILSS